MEYLALSILGENHPEIASDITRIMMTSECNILDCHFNTLGIEFAGTFLLAGTWNALAKLERQFSQLEEKYGLQIIHQRTKPREYSANYFSYVIYIIAPDKSGIVHEVTKFLTDLGILMESLYCEVYAARNTGTRMLSLNVSVSVPETMAISDLRERFFLFCDQFNLDGMLEPDKSQ